MTLRQIISIVFLSFAVVLPVYAQEGPLKNVGFVPSNIWYSKDSFFAGETIRVYTVIFNGSEYDIEGTVQFFDNGTPINKAAFTVQKGGKVEDVSVEYVTKEGNHIITARIVDASVLEKNGKKKLLSLENKEAGKSEINVELDTDSDGIGNKEDFDDDNDGISDVDEIRNGTDPLLKDTDGDGVSDADELKSSGVTTKGTSDSVSESTATSTGFISSTVSKINAAIPQSVKVDFDSGVGILERFRVGQGYEFRLDKETREKEIQSIVSRQQAYLALSDEEKATASGIDAMYGTVEKPFTYVMLAFFAVLQFIFESKIIFYGVLLYIFYRTIKKVFFSKR